MPTTSPITQPVKQCTVAVKAARFRSWSACACKALHRGEQLAAFLRGLLRIARRQRVGDAVVDVFVQELEGEALERGVHGGDLREDVDAVPVVVHHPLDPADLSLDSMQPLRQDRLVVAVLHAASLPLWNRLSRKLFVTTKSDETAIA